MKNTNKRLAKVRRTIGGYDFLAFKDAIRCGFELETQSTDDYTAEGINQDRDAAIDDEVSRVLENVYEVFDQYFNTNNNVFLNDLTRTEFNKVLEALNISNVSDLCDRAGECYDTIVERIHEDAREDIDILNPEGLISVPRNLAIKLDSSVDGFEFVTDGPRTYAQFITSVVDIFQLDHVIDENCSFHIHLSVSGLYHTASRQLIQSASEYVLNNIFKYRWAKKRMNNKRYFKPNLWGDDKYSLIRFHPSYRTYEFRIFGNIKSAVEAKQALDLAIQAMWHAYQRMLDGDSKPEMESEAWLNAANKSMDTHTPFDECLTGVQLTTI